MASKCQLQLTDRSLIEKIGSLFFSGSLSHPFSTPELMVHL